MDGTGEYPARRRTLLGDSERDRLVAILREHYAAGRLSSRHYVPDDAPTAG